METRRRILVANGNDDVLAVLDDVLSEHGYEVKTVHVRAIRLGQIHFGRPVTRCLAPRRAHRDGSPAPG
jgi:hypothetical protein